MSEDSEAATERAAAIALRESHRLSALSHVDGRAFNLARDRAIEKTLRRRASQDSYDDIVRIGFNTVGTPADLVTFYRELLEEHLSVASVLVDHEVYFASSIAPNAQHVPVTTPYMKDAEENTFLIVEIAGPEGAAGPLLQIAVKHADNYSAAFRSLYPGENRFLKPWFAFSGAELPQHLFKEVKHCRYGMAYEKLESVRINNGIFKKLFSFFIKHADDEDFTNDIGIVYKDTLFFVLGEGMRFWVVQQLILTYAFGDSTGWPDALMVNLINEWSDISYAVISLWLSDLEKDKADAVTPRMFYHLRTADNILRSYEYAAIALKKFEAKFRKLMTFRDSPGVYVLSFLAGRRLFLLKHRRIPVLRVLMRKGGYWKLFLDFPKSDEDN